MVQISIILSSVRSGRASNRVAIFLQNYVNTNNLASVNILDLKDYNFPVFDERLRLQTQPSESAVEFANRIKESDGIIIVTPEYNGGYPASLKNIIDLLYDEWFHKPVAITTVSNGPFGGSQVITSLLFVLWKMKAWVVTATFPVTFVNETFNEEGVPVNKAETEKRVATFLKELFWCIKARQNMI
jgi:NAD(P)H-dependent FMN reductase